MNAEIRKAIDEAFLLLPNEMNSPNSEFMIYAIGFQESDFVHRRQKNNGPAASFWQFERGGGILGVLNHPKTAGFARKVCEARGVFPTTKDVWNAMLTDDVLGAAFARLLLWSDPRPIPHRSQRQKLWDIYNSVWRPGKPHPDKWAESCTLAELALE